MRAPAGLEIAGPSFWRSSSASALQDTAGRRDRRLTLAKRAKVTERLVKPASLMRARLSSLPRQLEDLEDSGRRRAAGQGGPQRLRHRAELDPGFARQDRARPPRSPRRSSPRWPRISPASVASIARASGVSKALRLVLDHKRPVGPEEPRAVEQFDQRFRALLQAGIAARSFVRNAGVSFGFERLAACDMRQRLSRARPACPRCWSRACNGR